MSNIITVELHSLDIYSLTVHNNKIKLIDEIFVRNDSDYNLKNIEIEVSSSPSFFTTFSTKVSEISSGRYIVINNNDLDVDITKIMYLSQPSLSVVSIKVKSMGETISETTKNILLLPYDYLPPISAYTELISTFVTPEQDEIKNIANLVIDNIKSASIIPLNRDMWDYRDARTVKEIIRAIYASINDLKITFNTSNYYLESKPVQIKLAESVYATRSASGFEIALLAASVAEYFSVNSFIVFTNEKTLVGFFYSDDSFSVCVSDDGRELLHTKDGAEQGFCVLDTTSMINGTQVSFENSLITAQKAIEASDYPIVVDIRKSRDSGYVALPKRIRQNGNLIFDMLSSAPLDKNVKFDTEILKSPKSLSGYVINSLSKQGDRDDNTEAENLYLVGNVSSILRKFYLNGKLSLKSFPVSSLEENSQDKIEKLIVLNSNIDDMDVSDNVSAFHDKSSMTKYLSTIVETSKSNDTTICLAMGALKQKNNGKINIYPLYLVPLSVERESSENSVKLKLMSTDFIPNKKVVDILNKAGAECDLYKFSENPLENFQELRQFLINDIKDIDFLEFFDIVSICTFDLSLQELIARATPDYFAQSSLLSKFIENGKFDDDKGQDDFSFDWCDLPFSLDSTQIKALSYVSKNDCTIIKGANGSGKTRIAASVTFSELRKGKKILYLTDSAGNVRKFNELAKESGFKNYIMNVCNQTELGDTFVNFTQKPCEENVKEKLLTVTHQLSESISNQNLYYESLHKVNEIGFSLYEAASQYERYRSFPYSVNFNNSEIGKLSRNDVVSWFDSVSAIAKAGADCKEPHLNPLSYVRVTEFSYDLKSRATISLGKHISIAQDFIDTQNEFAHFLGIDVPIMTERQTDVLVELLKFIISNSHDIYYGLFNRSDIDTDFIKIESMLEQCQDIFEIKSFLNENFTQDISSLDCEALLGEWRNANSKFAFSRTSAINQVKNKLKAYSLNPKLVTNDNIVDLITKISKYKKSLSLINDNSSLVYATSGIDLKTAVSENNKNVFEYVKEIITASKQYFNLINELYDTEQIPNTFFSIQGGLYKNHEKLLSDIKKNYSNLVSVYEDYKASEDEIVSILDIDIQKAKSDNEKLWYYFLMQFLIRMNDNIDLLKYWCNWNVEKHRATNLGLEPVIRLYESEQISSSDIKNAFLKGFFKSVTEYFLSNLEAASNFSKDKHNQEMSTIFCYLDVYRKLLSTDLKNTCYNNYKKCVEENFNSSFEEAEISLKKNFAYGTNFAAPSANVSLLQNAKPCFLCTSASFMAQFKNLPMFDTVIIDSTSEKLQNDLFLLIPLAKKLIILDTDYHNKNKLTFARVLEQCGAPVVELGWLYNTNYASELINTLFYDNTFSSFLYTKQTKNGVNIIHQLGTYDRRKTRVNVMEASAVVDEVFRIINEMPDMSIGVYAMTDEQRALIEMLLAKRISTASQKYVKKEENFFIRTLDGSEYDQRDIIIFSTVFSAEEKPKYRDTITKSIYELSKEKSITNIINVFTSARTNFTLVTSLSEQTLNNFKTTEKNYCIFKKIILRLLNDNKASAQEISACARMENSIIREVSNHIESLGYKVDLNVGVNKCKIDIAVKNKGKSNYLLGIVFDETAYINSDDFFGRDLILKGLEQFGKWKILRIYTVEWFENHTKQLDMISSCLKGDEFEREFSISSIGE